KARALGNTSDAVGNAKDMGTYLLSHGWKATQTPQAGAIVVYQPHANSADATVGHVGIVSGNPALGANHRTYTYTLESANWAQTSQFSDSGCDNVSLRGPLTYAAGTDKGVTFY